MEGQYTQQNIMRILLHTQSLQPYVTTIGLYNDNNDLLAVGKLSHPIKNDPELVQ